MPIQKCKTVFVIDNNHDSRVSIRRQLEDAGHFVVSSASSLEALQLAGQMSAPSLILLGGRMPTLDSSQFLTLLKKIPGYEDARVLQIGLPADPRIEGTELMVSPNDMRPIIQWLGELDQKTDRNTENANLYIAQ